MEVEQSQDDGESVEGNEVIKVKGAVLPDNVNNVATVVDNDVGNDVDGTSSPFFFPLVSGNFGKRDYRDEDDETGDTSDMAVDEEVNKKHKTNGVSEESTSSPSPSKRSLRNYRNHLVDSSSDEEPDGIECSGTEGSHVDANASSSLNTTVPEPVGDDTGLQSPEVENPEAERETKRQFSRRFVLSHILSSMSDSDEDKDEIGTERSSDKALWDDTVAKEIKCIEALPQPVNNWFLLNELNKRQNGGHSRQQMHYCFSRGFSGSLHTVKHLAIKMHLDYHRGCVNSLSFNPSGSLLASGSDDIQIAVWDWARKKKLIAYDSGHRDNVFQSTFLPLKGDTHIVSCARDGQVRLAELTSGGVCRETRRLARHTRAAHKLATRPTCPHVVLSAGKDAVVLSIDIREKQPKKIALVKDVKGTRVALYSIDTHPINEHQFAVGGHDQYVRVFDNRCGGTGVPVLKYAPHKPENYAANLNVTSAVYSSNGDAILASYNDDDIYLFDTELSEGADAIHRYRGHRNNATVKGVNFFGPNSEFVISGSDCGNVFFWDRHTESIVQCVSADSSGVVNVLEPHPHLPVLATSGLDSDIKVWLPCEYSYPQFSNLNRTIRQNLLDRLRDAEETNRFTAGFNSEMMRMIIHGITRRRVSARGSGSGSGSRRGSAGADGCDNDGLQAASDSDSELSDDSDPGGIQCASQ